MLPKTFLCFVFVGGIFCAGRAPAAPPMPHHEELAPGVFAAGFSHAQGHLNCGWIVTGTQTMLVDLPRGLDVQAFIAHIGQMTGKSVGSILLTRYAPEDRVMLEALRAEGMRLFEIPQAGQRVSVGDETVTVEHIGYGDACGEPGAAVYLPKLGILFAGPVNLAGPRAALVGSNTFTWLNILHDLERLNATRIVPGRGSWGGAEVLTQQAQWLTEFRRQVGHAVSMGYGIDRVKSHVRLPDAYYKWMPYDHPLTEDIEHVYREMTVPHAPFNGRPPEASDTQVHALALIGDHVHEPGHIEQGLRPAFQAARIVPHFTVDYRALSDENLAHVSLLVILRDGTAWPEGRETGAPYQLWMTPQQQEAVVNFVNSGGAVLHLHNSLGLYPEGPYLDLIGGRFTSHGPLERFRVEVIDKAHPVTAGVSAFFVADEQHTPVPSEHVHVILKSYSDDRVEAAAGWVREAGRGRICHLANGHTGESLRHPEFQKLLQNAMRWLTDR